MPRLNVVEPDQATGKTLELYEVVRKKMGKVINIFKGMGNSPAGLNSYMSLSGALAGGELTPAEREVVALVMGQMNDCHYCLAAHTVVGKMVGISAEEALNIRRDRPTDTKHKALVDFIKAVIETKGYVLDEQLRAVRDADYTDGQIVEIIGLIAQNTFTNLFNHVNETEIDFPEAPEI